MSHLAAAAERLRQIEELLVCATPEAIGRAEGLLEEAAQLIAAHRDRVKKNAEMDADRELGGRVRMACERVAKLLEGARRAQWIRMRLVMSLTQTYTAGAQTKLWSPPTGGLNVRM